MTDFAEKVRRVPDFPQKGINFWDFTTLFQDPEGFEGVIDAFADHYADAGIDKVVGIESRGFIVGAPLAYKLHRGFVIVRKKGKLPYKKIEQSYEKEYGKDTIEIHEDAIKAGEKVLIVDDLLATGDTMLAAVSLVERLGGVVAGIAFIVEFTDFKAQERLEKYDIFSLIKCSELD